MKLEDIVAEIRPRSNWEAVDLGWVLTRRHFGRVLLSWILTIWPIWALIIGLLRDSPVWAVAIIVLLKPFYDHIPLFVLSRGLFGAPPSPGAALKAWPRLFFSQFFRVCFVSRFSAWRSLTLPVADLEGLSGNLYFRRASILSNRAGGVGWWMQISCWMLMHSVWIGMFLFIMFFTPAAYKPDLTLSIGEAWAAPGEFLIGLWFGEVRFFPLPLVWLWIGLYLMALTFMHPLYVGGGFGLYINARTHIEGWDIELTLRRLANRLSDASAAAAIAFVVIVFGLVGGQQLLAQEDGDAAIESASTPDAAIGEILEHPDFEIHKTKDYYYPERRSSSSGGSRSSGSSGSSGSSRGGSSGGGGGGSGIFAGAGGAVQALFWIVIAAAVILVVWLIVSNLPGFRRREEEEEAKAKTVMGMSVVRESLPPDVITVARKHWSEGEQQEAIGLLYRASISWLIESRNVPIEESDTEVDCVRRAQDLREEAQAVDYFGKLTKFWVSTAYGGLPPSTGEANDLFDKWPYDLRPVRR